MEVVMCTFYAVESCLLSIHLTSIFQKNSLLSTNATHISLM